MITPPSAATAPPLSPVPEPLAKKGVLCFWQHFTISETSFVDLGRTTASAPYLLRVSPSHS